MDADQAATFFGVMLFGGVAGTAIAAARAGTRHRLVAAALPIAALVAAGAAAGSLYFSESAGFVPCELCWYQRIAMYPMALLLPIAAVRRDRPILPYALLLSVIGLAVSLYHVQLQLFPEQSSFCGVANPCSARWVEAFGWLTIPQMAGLSFALVSALMTLSLSAAETALTKETP